MHDAIAPELDDMRCLTPAEKAAAGIAMMRDGIAMKRLQLRRRLPLAKEDEIDHALLAWLAEDRDV